MKKLFLIALIVISFIPLISLLHPGLPITNDAKDHVFRTANFYQNLQQGIAIPRWGANLNWGYGHPVLEFLYPLPYYLASLSHFLGLSFIDSVKSVFVIGFFISGVCMYIWLAEFLSMQAAFIGGLLYVFTPYRFVEIYVRGDIGENLAFIFMPLTVLFLYKIYKKTKRTKAFWITNDVILGAISFAGLMISHNAMVLMYFPFIIGYCLYLCYLSVEKRYILFHTMCSIFLGFILSAFFWLPAFIEGKYTLRDIVTSGAYTDRFVSFKDLLYGPWNYSVTGTFTKQLGLVNWICLLLSCIVLFSLWKRRDKNFVLIIGLLVYTGVAIFLMLPQSSFIWQHVMLLQNFQFPWRFLAVTVFSTCVLGAIVVANLFSNVLPERLRNSRNEILLIVVLGIVILFFNKDYWFAKGYLYKPDSFFTGVYAGTSDTGESSPIWSIRFMEQQPKSHIELIAGKGTVKELQRSVTKHLYSVSASTDITLRDNTVYFPGWEVRQDGISVPIQYQDPHNRGVITFPVSKGQHMISVVYKETKLRIISDYISLSGIMLLFGIAVVSYITKQRTLRYNKSSK